MVRHIRSYVHSEALPVIVGRLPRAALVGPLVDTQCWIAAERECTDWIMAGLWQYYASTRGSGR